MSRLAVVGHLSMHVVKYSAPHGVASPGQSLMSRNALFVDCGLNSMNADDGNFKQTNSESVTVLCFFTLQMTDRFVVDLSRRTVVLVDGNVNLRHHSAMRIK